MTTDVLIEDQRNLDEEIHQHQPLCAQLVRHDLHRVADQQARPGDVVEDAVQEDEEDDRLAGREVVVEVVHGRTGRPQDEADEHAFFWTES